MGPRYFSNWLLTVVLSGALAGAVSASDETRPPEGFERERIYSVPVQAAGERGFEIERIVVDAGDRRLGVDGHAGIVRESQDRIRLRGIPVIGQVFMDRLTRSDFMADREVGDAHVEGRTLFVALHPGRQDLWFDTVIVVHGRFSYRFQGRLSGVSVAPSSDPRPVGKAYVREDALLVLIRSSIITDSIL